ncbi:hypothetical protein BFINE_43830 [Bacteroides finegoldii DSM 17565]|nr:hypothetical protein BFINE_43830 [Bacteroides finegoldii DSM 17565]
MLGKKMYGAYFDSSKAQGIVLDTVSTNIKYAIGENSSFSVEFIMRMNPVRMDLTKVIIGMLFSQKAAVGEFFGKEKPLLFVLRDLLEL